MSKFYLLEGFIYSSVSMSLFPFLKSVSSTLFKCCLYISWNFHYLRSRVNVCHSFGSLVGDECLWLHSFASLNICSSGGQWCSLRIRVKSVLGLQPTTLWHLTFCVFRASFLTWIFCLLAVGFFSWLPTKSWRFYLFSSFSCLSASLIYYLSAVLLLSLNILSTNWYVSGYLALLLLIHFKYHWQIKIS